MPTTPVRRIGLGWKLGVDPAGSTTFQDLAVIAGIEGPDAKTDEVDVTLLADVNKVYLSGSTDPGHVTFEIVYDPDSTATTVLTALLTSKAIANWQITANPTTTVPAETFKGYVNEFKRTIKRQDLVMANVSIRVTGTAGYTGE